MEIILPDSQKVKERGGAGGYIVKTTSIPINKMVDVLGFYRAIIPAYSKADEHYHEKFVEIFYTLTSMRIKINGVESKLPPRTIIVLQPGDRHEEYADEESIEYLVLKLPEINGDKILID